MFAQGKAGQVRSCGNGRLSLSFVPEEPHPHFSTWACHGLRGHFPLGRLAPSSLPGPWATARGGQNYLEVDYFFPQEKGGIIIILLPPCDLG